MTEVWKPVLDYEDCYEVSDLGNLRRSLNRFGNPSGRPVRRGYNFGYVRHTISKDGVTWTTSGHRLVWEAFNGRIPADLVVNHKNGVKDDNRLENLEIVTASENTRHAFRVLGRKAVKNPRPGTSNGRALITDDDVREIRFLYAAGETQKALANRFGLGVGAVGCVVRGETWRHVA